MLYDGANGLTLGAIGQLSFMIKHSSLNDAPNASPYLRIFTNNGAHDVIFDATSCLTVVPLEDVFRTYEVTDGTDEQIRYDDDACAGPPDGLDWAETQAAHASEIISGIFVTTGFTGGVPLAAILRSLSVNGSEFVFGS